MIVAASIAIAIAAPCAVLALVSLYLDHLDTMEDRSDDLAQGDLPALHPDLIVAPHSQQIIAEGK